MQRRLFIPTAASVLALGVVACGDGGGGSTGDDKKEIARVVKLAFTTQDAKLGCEQLVTKSLVAQVYGGVSRCIKSEQKVAGDQPPTDVPVSGIALDGDSATAQTRFVGGDSGGASGTVRLRKEGGKWRIDDYGANLLRSVFKLGLEGQLKNDKTFAKPRVRACVTKIITDLPDDRLKRLAYDAIGDRAGADAEYGKLLTPCLTQSGSGSGSGQQSFVREKFETGIRRSARRDGLSKSAVDCVIRKLRSSISDEEIGSTVTDNNRQPTAKMQRAIVAALTACGATAGAGSTSQ